MCISEWGFVRGGFVRFFLYQSGVLSWIPVDIVTEVCIGMRYRLRNINVLSDGVHVFALLIVLEYHIIFKYLHVYFYRFRKSWKILTMEIIEWPKHHTTSLHTPNVVSINLFGILNAHALNVTSESCSQDKQTHMALSKSRLRIHLCNFKLFNNVLSFS